MAVTFLDIPKVSLLIGILGWWTGSPFLLEPLIHVSDFGSHICGSLFILRQGPWPKNLLESFTPTIALQSSTPSYYKEDKVLITFSNTFWECLHVVVSFSLLCACP